MKKQERVALGKVCYFLNGGTPSKSVDHYFKGDIPWITGADITTPVVTKARSFITKEAIENSATNRVPPGAVLLVTRTSVGKVAIAGIDLCFSQDITALTPDSSRLHAPYLVEFLKTRQALFERQARGATIKGITRQVVADLEIPLPPLAEQKRIAAILDAAEALREKRRRSLAKLDTLTQSIFLDIFGDPVANPKEWEKKPIGEIGRVITGNTPPREKPEYYGNEIEWVKSDNLNTPQANITKAEERLSKEGKLVARTVPAGSILVTCIAGSPSCIGNAAITDREVAFNQQITALVPKQADFRFLFAHIVVGKRLVQEASTAGMKGMVSKSRFEKIRLMYPPLNLQRTFAAAFDKIEDQKTAQRSSLEKLDELFRSLQHRAFRGEL